MSFRLEMLQVCRLAPKLLGDSTDLTKQFVLSQQNSDGGFNDREGKSDLYYTVFGLDSLIALQTSLPLEPVREYLLRFGDGRNLDFVHLCALLRCWAAVSVSGTSIAPPFDRHEIAGHIEQFRTQDGGYNVTAQNRHGTVYGCFLALGACQDLNSSGPAAEPLRLPHTDRLLACLDELRTPDGAWANDRHMKIGSTNATAAAVTLLRHLGGAIPSQTGDWLLAQAHPMGGFLAAPGAPIPDLLSTATALHALSALQCDFSSVQEGCLDFIDSLWTNAGSFHGNWTDDTLDCEYTFYGLLALGHLS